MVNSPQKMIVYAHGCIKRSGYVTRNVQPIHPIGHSSSLWTKKHFPYRPPLQMLLCLIHEGFTIVKLSQCLEERFMCGEIYALSDVFSNFWVWTKRLVLANEHLVKSSPLKRSTQPILWAFLWDLLGLSSMQSQTFWLSDRNLELMCY